MTESLTNYRLALIQMRSVFLGRTVNLNKAEASIREAAGHGAKLVCLPEAFDIGYDGTRIPDMMIDDQGTLLGGYSKTHPVGDERKYLQRGTEYPVFDTKLGKIGISICYDACFPETSRLLALKGAEVMLVPAAWRGNFYFKEWWDLNLACRALDNLMYVAAVNMIGPTGEQYFAGKSQLCSPIGEVLCTCGVDEERILYGEVDLSRIAKEREFNTVLIDRHPEDYNLLSQL